MLSTPGEWSLGLPCRVLKSTKASGFVCAVLCFFAGGLPGMRFRQRKERDWEWENEMAMRSCSPGGAFDHLTALHWRHLSLKETWAFIT